MKHHVISAGLFVGMLAIVQASDVRVGLIGLDTSHVIAFTQLLNDTNHPQHIPGARVTAAFRGGSYDLESSRSRLDGYTRELQEKYGVKLCVTIEELCAQVDGVMLESVDGRPHLAQAVPVILARKPLYIDKPMAASLRDAIAIFNLAREYQVPVFSCSSLRYAKNTQAVRGGAIGRVLRAETTSPCALEPTHPDLFWYGIHGVESLYTVMKTGCESVRRTPTTNGPIEVVGTWKGGRTGVFRESKEYGGKAQGEKGEMAVGSYDGYAPMVAQVIRFFHTRLNPISPEETLEILAFMEAADESKRRQGEPVRLDEIYQRSGYESQPAAELIEVRKIWDAAPHNAFTDLIRFRGQWLCVFREGQGHVSPDGAVRVLASADGIGWDSVARLECNDADLRDPKITQGPSGELMLTAAAAMHPPASAKHQTRAWFSQDARQWSAPVDIGEPNFWLWRTAWQQDTLWGIGYDTQGEKNTRLYRSSNGKAFETWVSALFDQGQPNETGLAFLADQTAICLLRRDGNPGTGQLGISRPPYRDWTWSDLGVKIGGPQLVCLPGGTLVGGVRLYSPTVRTALVCVDARRGRLKEILSFPSGGDTSYPGLVWQDNALWISYYSSHEGKTAIYLAKVGLVER